MISKWIEYDIKYILKHHIFLNGKYLSKDISKDFKISFSIKYVIKYYVQ